MQQKRYRETVPGVPSVLVAEDIDVQFEVMVIAAIKAYQTGLKSVDRLLRKYGDQWREGVEERNAIMAAEEGSNKEGDER